MSTLEDWTRYLEDGEQVDVVYADFQKAFDSVPHGRLLSKLHGLGIRGKLLKWIEAFLTMRRQRIVVSGTMSDWREVASGIPQGSVLGPTLFLLFVNDLPKCVTSKIKLFADDAKVYSAVGADATSTQLQDDLAAMVTWSEKWLLPFNVAKCSSLHLGPANPGVVYSIAGTALRQSVQKKDLGVLVDDVLKCRPIDPAFMLVDGVQSPKSKVYFVKIITIT